MALQEWIGKPLKRQSHINKCGPWEADENYYEIGCDSRISDVYLHLIANISNPKT